MKQNYSTTTPELDQLISENYLLMPVKKLAREIGKSGCFVKNRLRYLNLTIPADLALQRQLDSRKKTGDVPGIKGKKLTPAQYERSKHTFFKKGNVPHNTLKDGDITLRRFGKSDLTYKMIRISKRKWEFLHRYNWIQEFGTIPEGMMIIFKDRDQMHCEVENLEMITMEENMIRNSILYKDYPEELIKAAQSIAILNKTIKKITETHGE